MKHSQVIQHDIWSFFDKIYCISLDERSDRREQARKEFADIGLSQRVEFVIVAKHPDNQEKGIYQSHMNCLTRGLRANARRILIFEDDVFFENFDADLLHEACTYLDSTTNWNALFLGCITDGSRKTGIKNLVEIRYRCLAHAYVLNQPFARRIVQKTWSGTPFDELLRHYNENFFAPYPMCAFQGLAGSDNNTVAIDRVRRLLGGLPFIQKTNELYQNHKMVLLPGSFAALFIFAGLILWWW